MDADRFGQAGRFFQARVDVAPGLPAKLRQDDEGAGAAAEVSVGGTIEYAQSPCSSSSTKLIGCSG
jgi:hypothetical protein